MFISDNYNKADMGLDASTEHANGVMRADLVSRGQ